MLRYYVIQRPDPRDLTLPKKYYAVPRYNVAISDKELKKEIARFTTVSGPDIGAVDGDSSPRGPHIAASFWFRFLNWLVIAMQDMNQAGSSAGR